MAITIQQQPTLPNMGNAHLLWVVTSNSSSEAQFQYVADVYVSGSSTRVQRVKQQPNPSAKGVFDLGTIIPTSLDSDNVWKAAPFATSSESNKDFIVKFGEEYGTSASSSVVLYDGAGSAGDPNTTGSQFYTITNGLVEPDSGDWNFASSSYYSGSITPTGGTGNFTRSSALSNGPKTQSIQDGEYETVSFYNGNFDASLTNAQDIYYVQFTVYNAAGSQIQNIGFYNTTANGGGPRTSEAQEWNDVGVYNGQTNNTRLIHLGVGPQNLADSGNTLNTAWSYYTVTVVSNEGTGVEDGSAIWDSFRFNKDTANCDISGKRFAWKNEFGVWDYFTFKLTESTVSNLERNSFEQSFVDYSVSTNSVPYSRQRRGMSQYYNKVNKQHAVESDYLNQATADALRELFFSTDVYVQEGTEFVPVVISNASITEKTNPRAQKLFRYTAEYKYANEVRPRV